MVYGMIASHIAEALRETRVLVLAGARPAGKTTLVHPMAENVLRHLTLDDE